MIKSIILLSGGLDSLVSSGIAKDKYNVDLALTFNYGQKSAQKEINSSKKICDFYHIKHNVIELDFLREITQTSLVTDENIPSGKAAEDFRDSTKSVWVPNRNGLFLNIAASFADSYGYDYIIFGANKEEAQNFSDNTLEFIKSVNEEFKYSTQQKPQVIVPLINYNKNDIVKIAIDNEIPLEMVMSCYKGENRHCGECESCVRLKKALEYNHRQDLIKELFK